MTNIHVWNYFDIETTGINPLTEKTITIQYQPLYYSDEGDRIEHEQSYLHILREWESSEKDILQNMFDEFLSSPEKRENFSPLGNNLSFEGKFLKYRLIKYEIITEKTHLEFGRLNDILDLRHILIPINKGFRNYAKYLGKVGENKMIPEWYNHKQYDKIEKYIIDETNSFIKTFDYLMKKLPELKNDILNLHPQ